MAVELQAFVHGVLQLVCYGVVAFVVLWVVMLMLTYRR